MAVLEKLNNQFLLNMRELIHDDENFYIVTDYAKEGDLLDYFCNLDENKL